MGGDRHKKKASASNTTCIKESLAVKESQVVKCYLECHLAHKDGSKDVVGDGEEDSFLDRQTGAEKEARQSDRGNGAIRGSQTLLTAPLR